MIGKGYWSTGITLTHMVTGHGPAWSGRLDFLDDGFINDVPREGVISTQGTLATRYAVHDGTPTGTLSAVIDVLIADAGRLGIEFREDVGPHLYMRGDGESAEYPPPDGWRDLLAREAARVGFKSPYAPGGLREVAT